MASPPLCPHTLAIACFLFSFYNKASHGRVAELVYATDLKSVGLNNLAGSSPASPTT